MHKAKLLCVLLLLVLGSCANQQPYQHASGPDTAQLVIAGAQAVRFARGTQPSCAQLSEFAVGAERFQNIMVVPAGRPIWVGLTRASGLASCRLPISFTPIAGRKYAVTLDLKPGIGVAQCTATVRLLDATGTAEGAPPSSKESWPLGCS